MIMFKSIVISALGIFNEIFMMQRVVFWYAERRRRAALREIGTILED